MAVSLRETKPHLAERDGYRSGVSLLEVLISIFVLAIGLLGLAALIPVGRFAIMETGKSDRCGACGRAALRDVKVRRMLDHRFWAQNFSPGPFAIDPLGKNSGLTGQLGNMIPRINLMRFKNNSNPPPALSTTLIPYDLDHAEAVFTWRDELLFSDPDSDQRVRRLVRGANDKVGAYPQGAEEEEKNEITGPVTPLSDGNYSWFLTVMPSAGEANLDLQYQSLWSVSVVVCHKRDFTKDSGGKSNGEHTASVTFIGSGWGGGSVTLNPPIKIRENEWLMLKDGHHCKWYRVVSVGGIGSQGSTFLSLTGPDWDTQKYPDPKALVVDGVVGVYTTTIEREDDYSLWMKHELTPN